MRLGVAGGSEKKKGNFADSVVNILDKSSAILTSNLRTKKIKEEEA